jgi:enterochelin esterase-like enzyme
MCASRNRTLGPRFLKLLLPGLVSLSSLSPAGETKTADQPGPLFQAFVDRVNAALPGDRTAIVDSFMSAVPGFPFVEDSIAQFIYRGAATSVTVPGDANGWAQNDFPMAKLSTTDLWYHAHLFERDARLDYKFVLSGSNWILDPLNPHQVAGGFGPNSELAMPDYVQPWEIQYKPAIRHGRLESRNTYSVIRGITYTLKVYVPPGYDSSGISYPAAYFHDGGDYLNLGSTVNIIDNLIDSGKIAPIVAVFVTPTNRNEEYAGSVRMQYRLFFATELVPFIDAQYRTKRSPADRATIGDSFGGNISGLICYYHASDFGLCGLHSGAFWPNSYEAYNLIVGGPVRPDSLKFCSVWGSYEGSLTTNMRTFLDSLQAQGYDIEGKEVHEGHSWGQWRANTDMVLERFFPPPPVSVSREERGRPAAFSLEQNYPNPFNAGTQIRYSIPESREYGGGSKETKLVVYDLLGREVAVLVNEKKLPGRYEVEFDARGLASGAYFYRLEVHAMDGSPNGNFSPTRRLGLVK